MRPIRHSNIVPLLFLPSVVALIITAYYPGHITVDGIWQLSQARSQQYDDWHPPILAYLWGLIDRVWPGSGAILVIDECFLTAGIFLVVRRFHPSLTAAAVTVAIILSPPILGVSGMIAKDALLLSFLALALGLMLTAEEVRLRRLTRLLLLSMAAVLLLIAQFSRYNAFPLLVIAGYALLRVVWTSFRPLPSGYRRIGLNVVLAAVSVAAFAVVTVTLSLIDRHLLEAKQRFPYQQIMIYDLTVISIGAGVVLLDSQFYPYQDLGRLRQHFSSDTAESVIGEDDQPTKVHASTDPEQIRSLTRRWLAAIVQYPTLYLAGRTNLFFQLLALPGLKVCAPFFQTIDPNTLGLEITNRNLNTRLVSYLTFFQHSVVNRVWIYLLLAIVGTVYLLRIPGAGGYRTLGIVTGGALLYVAPYYFIAPSCEFRYVAPMILTGILATMAACRHVACQITGSARS